MLKVLARLVDVLLFFGFMIVSLYTHRYGNVSEAIWFGVVALWFKPRGNYDD